MVFERNFEHANSATARLRRCGLRCASAAPSSGELAAARSALRDLTRRGCLNGANEVSKESSATGREIEQRRGVTAQR